MYAVARVISQVGSLARPRPGDVRPGERGDLPTEAVLVVSGVAITLIVLTTFVLSRIV